LATFVDPTHLGGFHFQENHIWDENPQGLSDFSWLFSASFAIQDLFGTVVSELEQKSGRDPKV
jgi:hypothetical protein